MTILKIAFLFLCGIFTTCGIAQDLTTNKRVTHLYSLGASYVETGDRAGFGPSFSFSRLRNSENYRYKWGWVLQHGEYFPYGITDAPDIYFTMTSLGYTAGIDVLRIRSFSVFLKALALVDLYRNVTPKNLFGFQPALSGGGELGFRISNPRKRYGFQLTYPQIRFGTNRSINGTINLSLEVKIDHKRR